MTDLRSLLTPAQSRTFTACAEAAGLSLEEWVLECAKVQVANVIDAVQATERRRRAGKADNGSNAKHREQRARRIREGR